MDIVDTIDVLRLKRAHMVGRVGLVPTMGALHAGHLALVKQAQLENEYVVVTIFVNPTQFGAHEDLSKYPRNLRRDLELLEAAGVDLVFTPTPEAVYPPSFQTWIDVERVSQGLEGGRRPGHFRGVATVVAKLFNLVQPQSAYFGQKDAQQVVVIKQMTRDLNFPIEIRVCPTMREPDGLAMSSRNIYLSPEQRQAAAIIRKALVAAGNSYGAGERRPLSIRAVVEQIVQGEPLAQIDYVSVAAADTLTELTTETDSPMLISLVVKMGTTRLLDNMLLPERLNTLEGLGYALGGG